MRGFRELFIASELRFVGKLRLFNECVPFLQENEDAVTFRSLILSFAKGIDNVKELYTAAEGHAEEIAAYIRPHENVAAITVLDEDYPAVLNDLGVKKPAILYVAGTKEALKREAIAVVGTREPSDWTIRAGGNMVKKIVKVKNPVIISGLASGCDTLAHAAALKAGGTTAAVLPCGFERIFPQENMPLAGHIVKSGGCLVSEYPPDKKPEKYMFVQRDAVIAALSRKIIALECGVKSGTMHTMDAGLDMGRKLGAFIPVDMTMGHYEGNDLITDRMGGYPLMNTPNLIDFLKDRDQ